MNIFSGIVNMMGEQVIVHRAARTAGWKESRRRPRGRERLVSDVVELGAYKRDNRERVALQAIVFTERSSNRKRESGEIREAQIGIKSIEQIYPSDNATADYADVVQARGEFWKVLNVRYDRSGGLYVGQLGKLSDDESVDIGVGLAV